MSPESSDWDVLCVVYDVVHLAKRDFGGVAPGDLFDGVVVQAHVLMDMMLGRLFELAGPDVSVVLVSPNGLRRGAGDQVRAQPRGVLVASGPGIAADAMLPGAEAVDIAPTLLARYGLSVPSDGRVLQALVPAGTALRAVTGRVGGTERPTYDPADDLIAEGYLDAVTQAQSRMMADAASVRLLHLGIARMSRGAYAQAAQAFEAVLELRPDHQAALRRLAQARALLGDYAACRPIGEALLSIDPMSPWGHVVMGTWCALGGDAADAQRYLASARELGAEIPSVLVRLGGLALLRSRPEEAATLFEDALRLEADRPDALYGLGTARHQLGEIAAAEQALRRAIAAQYHQPLAHLQLGTLLAAQGRGREAVAALETALGQNPDSAEAAARLARAREGLAEQMASASMSGSPG